MAAEVALMILFVVGMLYLEVYRGGETVSLSIRYLVIFCGVAGHLRLSRAF